MDLDHQTLLSNVVFNWTDPEVDWILFSNISFTNPNIETNMIDAVMRKYKKEMSSTCSRI